MPKKISQPKDFDLLVSRYVAAELSTNDIALVAGVSKATVLKWMDAAGVPRVNKGQLIAKTRVGKGVARGPMPAETKAKLSAAKRGKPNGHSGLRRSDEARANMSAAARLRWQSHPDRAKHLAVMLESAMKRRQPVDVRAAKDKSRQACKAMLRRVLTMARRRKDARTELMLGYSKDELRKHLEAQFRPGMSWVDRDSFHIDHIVPVSHFLKRGIYDPSVINALGNLQVLTPEENRRKGDKLA